jgi:anaerobic selenocysteine-containing dehydrogenase
VPDLDRTDFLLMLGANPLASNGSLCTAPDFPGRLRALRKRGGHLVVVDPRRTETAKKADQHVFIRPGTDPLLLFAMVHTLFQEGWVNLGRLEGLVRGVDEVRRLAEPFAPSEVAGRCGVCQIDIRDLARRLAQADRAVVYGRLGTTAVPFGTLASWLVDVVNILTGNFDSPGGAMFARPVHEAYRPDRKPGGRGYQLGRWRSRVRDLPEFMGELPVATLADEIETPGEGQVRALITVAGNPVLSTPNSVRLERALQSLDLMVSVDPYQNETTRLADVILPPPSPLHRGHCDLAFYQLSVRNVVNYSPPVFPLEPGALDEWEILARLALIAGGQGAKGPVELLDEMVIRTVLQRELSSAGSPLEGLAPPDVLKMLDPVRGPERVLDFLLRAGAYGDHFGRRPDGLTLAALEGQPHGVDLGPLEPRLPELLSTPSAQIELAPEPIAGDVEHLRDFLDYGPDGEVGTGWVLVGRRHLLSNNSWMHNQPSLMRGGERCRLLVHPDDAARLGLAAGDHVRVRSAAGSLTTPVELTDDIMPGVVSLPHGWGHHLDGNGQRVAMAHPGVNSNRLTDERQIDFLSGNAVLNGIPVTIERV